VSGLTVNDSANAANWSLRTNLQVGNTLYGDRTFTVAGLPAALAGAAWIRPANASKSVPANPLVTFTISQGATVYVAADARSGKRSWMDSSWVDTRRRSPTARADNEEVRGLRQDVPGRPGGARPQNNDHRHVRVAVS